MSTRTCDLCGGTGRRAEGNTFVACELCKGHGTIFDAGVTPEQVQAAGYDPAVADAIAAKWPEETKGGRKPKGDDDPPPGPKGGVPKGN